MKVTLHIFKRFYWKINYECVGKTIKFIWWFKYTESREELSFHLIYF